ncbi:glycerol-3-phosphate acyltransferase [Neobacillus sp. YIM B06451]|uniref:glycerol-3-phosphate acyltransferase n=1 Tax=Neobacillus sp. YIM B06451 TaxID=3070994 RepID=UPI002930D07A|nr:glycerol-3-phosphate acyltransferase [Neobacillus sp. YIM B06451]
MLLELISIILLSYFLGGFTAAYYVTKWMSGRDIRKLGSGNAGAKNAGRQLGKKGFFYTLLLDIAKVIIALYITTIVFPQNEMMLLISALFLLMGHILPMQLGFKGGKGVVVFLASTLFLVPIAIPVLGIGFGIGYLFIRKFTIAGLISLASIPITAWIVEEYYVAIGLFTLLLIVVHQHIKRK